MDLLQPLQGQTATGLAVWAVSIRRRGAASVLTSSLGLSDGLTARGACLGDLPQKGPKDQPQIPAAVAGMRAVILLGQAPVRNSSGEEQFKLVQGRSSGRAEVLEQAGKAATPVSEI